MESLNGGDLGGRELRLDLATPRTPGGSERGGRGGGRGTPRGGRGGGMCLLCHVLRSCDSGLTHRTWSRPKPWAH